jgi:uncharacterized membrane protein YgcG
MRCPYCRVPLAAEALECPACRVTFPRASSLLGAVPRLQPGISDSHRLLDSAGAAKIKRASEALCRKFPQLTLQIVLHPFPTEHPFSLHAFWLFNAGAFAGDAKRGADNHAILLAIDPKRLEAAIVVGYGLEDFLGEKALDHLLELASPFWQQHRWSDGIMTVLDGLDRLCESTALLENRSSSDGDF